MEDVPRNKSRDETLAWLREKAPTGTLSRQWKNQINPRLYKQFNRMIPSPYLNLANVDYLHDLRYINEIGKYATPQEILGKINHRRIGQEVDGIRLEDKTLLDIFGRLPPYHGDVTPRHYTSIDEFDINILKPSYPSIPYPDIPADFPDIHGRVKIAVDSVKAVEADIVATQERFETLRDAFQTTSDLLEKCNLLRQLIELKFKVFGPYFNVNIQEPRKIDAKAYLELTTESYHSFLELKNPPGNWKRTPRLQTDSKQLIFARSVGGLILYLLTHIPPEQILDIKNSKTIFSLIQKYVYELGFTTYDMIAIGDHMKLIAKEVNTYVSYDFIVFDCENGGTTERCYRGVLYLENDAGRYRIVFTDVDMNAEITLENQMRLFQKYSTNSQKGGKRRTYKHKQSKKKLLKSRRWRK